MDIFFNEPDDVPVPLGEVEIRSLEAVSHPDGNRVAVQFEVTPFLEKPNFEITIYNPEGKRAASLSVVEAIENKMQFVMHLKGENPNGLYTLQMQILSSNLDDFDLGERESVPAKTISDEVSNEITQAEITFEVPGQ